MYEIQILKIHVQGPLSRINLFIVFICVIIILIRKKSLLYTY